MNSNGKVVVHPPAIRKYMSLRACQYILSPFCGNGNGRMISRGESSLAYSLSAKKVGSSSGLTQKDALRFGAKKKTTSTATKYFADDRTDALLNQVAAISEITSEVYIENLAANALDING